MGEFHQKEQKGSSCICQIYLDDPEEFWYNILGTDESKVKLSGRHGCRYIWHKANATFQNKNIIPTAKHGNGSVMVWAAFLLQDLGDFS